MKSLRAIVIGALSVLLLYACGGSSSQASSGTGLTQSQVQALIAQAVTPLQQQVTSLQTQVTTLQQGAAPAIFIQAPNAPSVKMQIRAQLSAKATGTTSAPTCTGLGTLTGRPADSDPIVSNNLSGVSCTGYYFTVSAAATSSAQGYIQPLSPQIAVLYSAPGCTGQPYVGVGQLPYTWDGVPLQGVAEGALGAGAVFTIGSPGGGDPSAYWMLPAGAASASLNMESAYWQGQCIAATFTLTAYPLQTNDAATSGVPSAPIPGPVTIG